jgi:hypothetical protein
VHFRIEPETFLETAVKDQVVLFKMEPETFFKTAVKDQELSSSCTYYVKGLAITINSMHECM